MKHTITFILRKDNSITDGLLVCRVKWYGCKAMLSFSLGYRVEFDKWDKELRRVKVQASVGSYKIPARKINKIIAQYENAVNTVFSTLNAGVPHSVVRDKIKTAISGVSLSNDSFFEALERFIQEKTIYNNWSRTTVNKFKLLRSDLLAFSPNIRFHQINKSYIINIIEYWNKTKNMQNSTIQVMYKKLVQFLRWCVEEGYLDNTEFEKIKPNFKQPKKPIIFLTWDELMRLWLYDTEDKTEDLVNDIFLFCCFSGLRISDALALTWADVREENIEVITKKTNDAISINLNKWTRSILKKYEYMKLCSSEVFPKIEPQTINNVLKVIGKKCKISSDVRIVTQKGGEVIEKNVPKYEMLTSHVGRKTFISNALALGIPADVVMKWTGHSDYKAMKPYIDVVDKTKKIEMSKFDNRRN